MSAEPGNDCAALRFELLLRADRSVLEGDAGVAGTDAGADGSLDPASGSARALDAHVAHCAACRRELARAERRTALVRSLTRVASPHALDGAVVASLQAGERQERAARAVASLTPMAAPDDLVRRLALPRAPAVLDRLVGEELADPAKAVASRYTRRLERLRAPDDLADRLGRTTPRPVSRTLSIALAAGGLVLTVGALLLAHVLQGTPRDAAVAPSGPILVVEHVESVHSLDPMAGQLLSGFLGGFVDADRLAREKL
ncbi:MAG: hypothetical protein NTY35_16495 [Planctomycetota bacterium]|nr:hypothetical protein [Planctomycetota bacterium]